MPQAQLNNKIKGVLVSFVKELQELYREELVSAILYGSAASGEFIEACSNLNLLVVLKNTELKNLDRSSKLINKREFRNIHPIFFTEEYIKNSTHIFPIEFLDMQENYQVLAGRDSLKDISIDTRNLRFQCEQELKSKLINLRQNYLRMNNDKNALRAILFKSFTSAVHLLRNVLRLKGKKPAYLREDALEDIALEFQVNRLAWEKIWAAKNKKVNLNLAEIKRLFLDFVNDLEKIIGIVDKL